MWDSAPCNPVTICRKAHSPAGGAGACENHGFALWPRR
jgi:hypothetical protein